MKAHRTYRFFAALVAFSLALGIVLPVLHQACAMERDAARAQHAAPSSSAPQYDEGAVPSQAEVPCNADADGEAAQRQESCCIVESATPEPSEAAVLSTAFPQLAPLLPVLAALLPDPDDVGPAERPASTSPSSPAPVALHVLHATFLN